MSEKTQNTFTIIVGGAAGDGAREAGLNIGRLFARLGYHVYVSADYPSLIRGGHNFSRLTVSEEKVYSDQIKTDLVIALNGETVDLHRDHLNDDAIVFAENFDEDDVEALGEKAIQLPLVEYAKELNAPEIARSSVALGALCYFLGMPLEDMNEVLHEVFKEKHLAYNVGLADKGYVYLKNKNFRHSRTFMAREIDVPHTLEFGNIAFAKGLLAAGLDYYVAYPMTPATSILHFMAQQQRKGVVKTIQPENEIAVLNLALGLSYAGKRAAVGTSGGGFALMQETFSLAGITEIPAVIAMSMRQGPASGVPTYTSQGDMQFVLRAGHGEFGRIVIAPGDSEEAYIAGIESLNCAWKYQTPAVVLLDKQISESAMTSVLDGSAAKIDYGRREYDPGADYKRYEISEDGISPMAFPGTPEVVVKVSSYEHSPDGITTEKPEEIKSMIDKRFKKRDSLIGDLNMYETVKAYGDENAETVVIFWGSTKASVLEASKFLDKPIKYVQVLWLEPLDTEELRKHLSEAKNIINVEQNHEAQFASLLREKMGIDIKHNILRYDSRPFVPRELAEEIEKLC